MRRTQRRSAAADFGRSGDVRLVQLYASVLVFNWILGLAADLEYLPRRSAVKAQVSHHGCLRSGVTVTLLGEMVLVNAERNKSFKAMTVSVRQHAWSFVSAGPIYSWGRGSHDSLNLLSSTVLRLVLEDISI